MAIIKFILVFACCVYLIRLLMRIAMPLLLRHLFGKMQQNANPRPTDDRPEGDVSIASRPPRKPARKHKLPKGEYVDFEEIK